LTRVRPVASSRSGPEVARAYPLSAPRAPQSDWQIDREADGAPQVPAPMALRHSVAARLSALPNFTLPDALNYPT